MMKKSALFAVLAVFAGCASQKEDRRILPPDATIARVLTDLRVDLAEDGLIVAADGLQLPWEASTPKSGEGQTSFDLVLKEPGTGMNLSFTAAESVSPALAISMVHATLELNHLTATPVELLDPKGTDLRVTFSGQSKELGRAKGQVRAWIVPGTKKTAILFALWLEKLDGPASADFNAVVLGVKAAKKK